MDKVDGRSNVGVGGNGASPDKSRVSTYRKAAEEAIQQYRSNSRGAFNSSSNGGPNLGRGTAGGNQFGT